MHIKIVFRRFTETQDLTPVKQLWCRKRPFNREKP